MNSKTRFPVGGPRQPVYRFLNERGFRMSYSDKLWTCADLELHLYGSGSMARIYKAGSLVVDAPLEEAVNVAAKPAPCSPLDAGPL